LLGDFRTDATLHLEACPEEASTVAQPVDKPLTGVIRRARRLHRARAAVDRLALVGNAVAVGGVGGGGGGGGNGAETTSIDFRLKNTNKKKKEAALYKLLSQCAPAAWSGSNLRVT